MDEQIHKWVMIIFISIVVILTIAIFLIGLEESKDSGSEKKIVQKMQLGKIVD